MRILVYVEGPSDRVGLDSLLRDLMERGSTKDVGLRFSPQGSKDAVLEKAPRIAADYLRQHPEDWVVALPDLYPMRSYEGTSNAHRSFAELARLLRKRFEARADAIGLGKRTRRRFLVHCLKHDLETLLLAAPDALRQRLGTQDALANAWRKPIEDQDDHRPPKRIVEALFDKYLGRAYRDTVDAPSILGQASLEDIEAACPQRFAPFVSELRRILGTSRAAPARRQRRR